MQFKSVVAILGYGFPVGTVDKIPAWAEKWLSNKNELEAKYGLSLITHGSTHDPERLLVVEESIQEARQGKPIFLGQAIDAKPEWAEKIKEFCRKEGIEYQSPQYILCSYWTE